MSDKIVIATDLDETTFSYLGGITKFVSEKYERILEGDPEFYDLYRSGWFKDDEEFKRIHGEAVDEGLYKTLKPYENASKTLWDLVRSGYQNNILTSRFVNPGQHEKVVADTAKSLEINSIPHSNLMFLHDKTRFIADVYIDDSPRNLLNLQKDGRTTITYNQRYNQDVPGLRASSWLEVREILRDLFGR